MVKHVIRGPYFEEFYNGQIFGAPAITVTSGLALTIRRSLAIGFDYPVKSFMPEDHR